MHRYFTSDLHLGSNLINKYAHRPFATALEAASTLCCNINNNLSKSDMLIHVGDFMLSGTDRHGVEEDIGLGYSLDEYLDELRPNIILISGNHDDGHNTETVAHSMIVDLNQNYRNVYVSHYPSYHKYYQGPKGWAKGFQIVLCGHVHDSWKVMWDPKKHVLNINVGVDVWNYMPVEDVQLTELLDFLCTQSPKLMQQSKPVYWKESDINAAKLEYKKQIIINRMQHKKERYAKRGLTPEECAKRRVEAMRKKGLDPNFKKEKTKNVEADFTHEDAIQFGMVPPDVTSPLEASFI